jgi:DNA-binding transcriptional MerR regulator
MPSPQDIPDKLYFRIGEVAEIIGVPSYVLRFWETEFPYIRPKRTDSGQRLYRRNDVELILTIKHLLHEKRFTIEGAKQHLRSKALPKPDGDSAADKQILKDIKVELERIRDLLV